MLTQECLQDALHYGECFVKLGKPAEYIPELARVNKYHLGVCVVGLDGSIIPAPRSPSKVSPSWPP